MWLISFWCAAGITSKSSWKSANSVRRMRLRLEHQAPLHRRFRRCCNPLQAALLPAKEPALLLRRQAAHARRLMRPSGQKRVRRQRKVSLRRKKAKNPLLPRLSQKMLNRKPLKVSLTELAEVKKALLRILCLPTVHQVTKVSRMCRQRKPAASHISTQSRYQSRWAVPLNETMHMSVSTMTVLRLMLNACWKKWQRKRPVSSLRTNASVS